MFSSNVLSAVRWTVSCVAWTRVSRLEVDVEELRRAGNCNCSDAQHYQGRRRGGNTNL
jgi:hypothetical protein